MKQDSEEEKKAPMNILNIMSINEEESSSSEESESEEKSEPPKATITIVDQHEIDKEDGKEEVYQTIDRLDGKLVDEL